MQVKDKKNEGHLWGCSRLNESIEKSHYSIWPENGSCTGREINAKNVIIGSSDIMGTWALK